MRSRRKLTKEFKLDAVQRLRAGEPAGLVARRLEVSRQELCRWSRDVLSCTATWKTTGRWMSAATGG